MNEWIQSSSFAALLLLLGTMYVMSSDQSLALIEHGVLKSLLKVISMGSGVTANSIGINNENQNMIVVQAALNALQTLIFVTSGEKSIYL